MNFPQLNSSESTRALDEQTMEDGVPGSALMEAAGAGAAGRILSLYPDVRCAIVLTGKGNNGGDGWVVARYLSNAGVHTEIRYVCPPEELKGDAAMHAKVAISMAGRENARLHIKPYENGWTPPEDAGTIVIDALLGTGLSNPVREETAAVIRAINETGLQTVALDVPSGLNATTGKVEGTAVKARHTLVFGVLKTGLFLNDGPSHTGQHHLIPLGFTRENPSNRYLLEAVHIHCNAAVERRHKYDSGVVYVAGGSRGLTGAAVMAGKAAWKSGCGSVFVLVPDRYVEVVQTLAPELICISRAGSGDETLTPDDAAYLLERLAERPGAVLIGPGLGRSTEAQEFVRHFLSRYDKTAIVDADALYALNHVNLAASHILTPHPGELRAILNESVDDDWVRLTRSEQLAQQNGHTIVSKGYPTLVCTADEGSWITGYDTRSFNRAGFGDVLAGYLAGLYSTTNQITFSCLKALTDGKLSLDKARQEGIIFPEPSHLL